MTPMRMLNAAIVLLICAPAFAAPDAAELAAVEKAFGPPVTWVAQPAKPPTIDGKLDDEAWKQATPVTFRYLNGLREAPVAATTARVLADKTALYVAVECVEPNMDRLNAAGKERDGALWNGDTVELFLDPGHKSQRFQYVHVIVNPDGLIFDARNKDAAWNADITAKTVRAADRWTVELSIAMKDLAGGEIPRVWGLNVNRQRPELGVVSPAKGITSTAVALKEPDKYREGEDTAWSPTDSYDSNIAQRFGHAVLEAGTAKVAPPEKLFELIYKYTFDDGKFDGWNEAKLTDENFRGPGKGITQAEGKGAIHFGKPLTDLDDVTLILCFKMSSNGRFYYYGRAPDSEQCEADFHKVYMTPAAAEARKYPGKFDYDTHGSMMAWKSHGRRQQGLGPWAMMTGHFSEPSIGSVMQPGTDWVILTTRPGQFRRQRGQNQVGIAQNYPRGLTFAPDGPTVIDNFILFRGQDLTPPETVKDVTVKQQAEGNGQQATGTVVSWPVAPDNTLTAYYEVLADGAKAAETHLLTATLKDAAGKAITVVAVDLYGNRAEPSKAVKAK